MSGRSSSAKPGPVFFTQQEIDALSAGRRPKTVTRQLKTVRTPAVRPARPATESDKPAPPLLKRSELNALRRGRPSPAVRKRLFAASEPDGPAARAADADADKPYPSQQPPVGPRKRA